MLRRFAARHPALAWSIGIAVLVALGIATGAMLAQRGPRVALPATAAAPLRKATSTAPSTAAALASKTAGALVRGIVRLPNGELAPGVTVVLARARTAWPEWQRETIDQAFTGRDGAFQFAVAQRHGLLLGFEHPALAGDLLEVPAADDPVELRLEAAFALSGIVDNEAGAPIANARVALEALPGEQRPVVVAVTGANGRYTFGNLRAGAVRLVVRHEAFQPATVPLLVIGETGRFDVRLDRRSMPPLRGRVASAGNQAPVAGAIVELVPPSQKLGLVDPIRTRTGADGAFVLAGVATGAMSLIVRHPDHGCVLRGPTVGVAAPDLLIDLPAKSTVRGRLQAESAGLWRAGDLLQLRDAAGQLARAAVAADGSFAFDEAVSPGFATLRTLVGDFVFQRSATPEVTVRIDEEESELAIAVATPARVRGRFVDADGRPLAGVAVMSTKVLFKNMKSIGDRAVQLDPGAFDQVLQLFGADRDEVLATSAADGTFEIRGLPPGDAAVQPLLRGFGRRWISVRVPPSGSLVQLGDLPLPRGARLSGRVARGEPGRTRPFAAAVVTIDANEGKAVVLSNARGEWSADDLAPGIYRVRARLNGQRGLVSESQQVEVNAGSAVERVELRLPGGREVRGVVTGRDGQTLAGALISLRDVGAVAAATDSSGEFVIELPERATELQVSLADRSRSKLVAVPAAGQRLTVALDTPPVATLLARVASLPGKRRMSAGLVRCVPVDGDSDGEAVSRWLEFPDGELRWPLCPSGPVRIEIRCDGFTPFVVERTLVANEEHALGDVLLEPGCRLRGIVRDAADRPIANAVVLLGDESDLELLDARTRTGPDGTFELRGVSWRSQRLVARAPGFAPTVVDLPLPEAVLSPRPFAIALSPGASVEVAVATELRDGAFVQLRRDGRLVATADIDERGRAVFGNRSAGDYTVQLAGGGDAMPSRSVRIRNGDDVVRVRLP
jgi:5-hydroxyisourate hydrolase-like protein (transthyretin family)